MTMRREVASPIAPPRRWDARGGGGGPVHRERSGASWRTGYDGAGRKTERCTCRSGSVRAGPRGSIARCSHWSLCLLPLFLLLPPHPRSPPPLLPLPLPLPLHARAKAQVCVLYIGAWVFDACSDWCSCGLSIRHALCLVFVWFEHAPCVVLEACVSTAVGEGACGVWVCPIRWDLSKCPKNGPTSLPLPQMALSCSCFRVFVTACTLMLVLYAHRENASTGVFG